MNTILELTFFTFLMKPFGETSNFYCIDIFSYIMRLRHDCDISTVFTDTSKVFFKFFEIRYNKIFPQRMSLCFARVESVEVEQSVQ